MSTTTRSAGVPEQVRPDNRLDDLPMTPVECQTCRAVVGVLDAVFYGEVAPGKRYVREDGGIGWQGIVPRRAARMAAMRADPRPLRPRSIRRR